MGKLKNKIKKALGIDKKIIDTKTIDTEKVTSTKFGEEVIETDRAKKYEKLYLQTNHQGRRGRNK